MSNTNSKDRFLQYLIILSGTAMLMAVGLYIYLGVFARPLADDYCEALLFQVDSLFKAVETI